MTTNLPRKALTTRLQVVRSTITAIKTVLAKNEAPQDGLPRRTFTVTELRKYLPRLSSDTVSTCLNELYAEGILDRHTTTNNAMRLHEYFVIDPSSLTPTQSGFTPALQRMALRYAKSYMGSFVGQVLDSVIADFQRHAENSKS
jgi:DNA-binding HxlR family transcriptional regulator